MTTQSYQNLTCAPYTTVSWNIDDYVFGPFFKMKAVYGGGLRGQLMTLKHRIDHCFNFHSCESIYGHLYYQGRKWWNMLTDPPMLNIFWAKGPSQAHLSAWVHQTGTNWRRARYNPINHISPDRSGGTPYTASVIECDKRVLCARDLLNDPRANALPVAMRMMARATICCPHYFPSPLDVALNTT